MKQPASGTEAGWVRAAGSAAHDLAGLQAGRAHRDPPTRAGCDDSAHLLPVRVPPAVGATVGVRDGHDEAGPLAADIADAGHYGLLGRADHWIGPIPGNPTSLTGGFGPLQNASRPCTGRSAPTSMVTRTMCAG